MLRIIYFSSDARHVSQLLAVPHFLFLSFVLFFFLTIYLCITAFGSSFLPKEESVTTAPETPVIRDYQASSQASVLSDLQLFNF